MSNEPIRNQETQSVAQAVFNSPAKKGDAREGKVPEDVKAKSDMGTIYLYENVLVPGGPGNSKKFSGPIVWDETTKTPRGIWFYPANPEQNANVSRYWFGCEHGIIQVKKKVAV